MRQYNYDRANLSMMFLKADIFVMGTLRNTTVSQIDHS